MKIDTVTCDVCGAQKKETNHWFLGFCAAWLVSIEPWDDDRTHEADAHLCGAECALKFTSAKIRELKPNEKETTPVV